MCVENFYFTLLFFFCIFQDVRREENSLKKINHPCLFSFEFFFLSFFFLSLSLVWTIFSLCDSEREQFDQQIRSQNIDPDSPTFRLITDGQLPLRQCLHPEACAKDIELPNYFCKFSDLRKEYVRFKSGDLSRALVAIKDVPNMPALPAQPTCIADMIAGT